MKKKALLAAAALAALMVPQVAGAEGFGIVEWSAEGVAMGGARMFAENDVANIAANPASLTKFKGKGVGVNATYISPHGNYQAKDWAGSTESGKNRIHPGIVPGMYYAQQMTDKDWWGIGAYTRYGMVSGFQPGSLLASNNLFAKMNGLSITPVYAHKFDKKWSAAVGAEINYVGLEISRDYSSYSKALPVINTAADAAVNAVVSKYAGTPFEAAATAAATKTATTTKQSAYAMSKSSMHLKGNSYALGWNAAVNYTFDDKNDVGVVYRSKIKHSLEADLNFYGALKSSGDAYGKVTLPDQWTIGYNHKFDNKNRLELNATRTNWHTYDALNMNFSGLPYDSLNGMHESYKGYSDTWRYAIGYEHKFSEKYSGMLGFAWDDHAIPYAGGDCMIPTGVRRTYSCGVQYHDKKQTLALALAWEDIGGLDFAGNLTAGDAYSNVHTHTNSAKVVSIGYSYHF